MHAIRKGEEPACAKCSEPISSQRGPKRWCYSCENLFHRSCWDEKPYPRCPECGALSFRFIKSADRVTQATLARFKAEGRETGPTLLGAMRESRADLAAKKAVRDPKGEYDKISKQVRSRKRLWFMAGVATCACAAVGFLGLVSWAATYAATDKVTFSLMCALALGVVAAGGVFARECFAVALARSKRDSPSEVVKRFYDEALSPDPNPDVMLELLHPDTVAGLGSQAGRILEDAWRDVRRNCENQVLTDPAYCNFEAARVDEITDAHDSERDVDATIKVSCWAVNRKRKPTHIVAAGRLIMKNKVVKTARGWLLVEPFPEEVTAEEASGGSS